MVKVLVNKDNWKDTIPIVIMHMRDMEMMMPASNQLHHTRESFADMARGGNGRIKTYVVADDNATDSELAKPSVRECHWPDAPDEFFAEVCDLLQWDR